MTGVLIKTGSPREGTALRTLYDLFMDNPGTIINVRPYADIALSSRSKARSVIQALVDQYSLDVKSLGDNCYILIGSYGKRAVYTDYQKIMWGTQRLPTFTNFAQNNR